MGRLGIAFLFVCTACAPGSAAVEAPAWDRAGALEQLRRWSGSEWSARFDPDLGTATFLIGRSPPLATPEHLEPAARRFLWTYRALFGLSRESELSHNGTTQDALGMRHLRFVQHIDQIPVHGSALTLHFDEQGRVLRVHGRTIPIDRFPVSQPTLAQEDARQQALALVRADFPAAVLKGGTPRLCYLDASPGGGAQLAWQLEISGQADAAPIWQHLFLSAQDGTLLRRSDLRAFLDPPAPAQGSGTGALGDRRSLALTRRGAWYYLEDQGRGQEHVADLRSGRTIRSKDPDLWDGDGPAGLAVDVHAHLATIWDYFATVHGHFGWDGRGRGPIAAVDSGPQPGLFDGRRLVFGAGAGDGPPPGAALDIVAHEYVHALEQAIADLAPEGQSGAAAEAIADLFACFVEKWARPQGGDWTIGEAIYSGDRQGARRALRDLSDPHASDQAKNMSEYRSGPGPIRQLRVANAGIVAHAGYQLAIRVGTETAAALFFRALGTYLHRYAGFADVADATIAAVLDLHGGDFDILDKIYDAWAQVGLEPIEMRRETRSGRAAR